MTEYVASVLTGVLVAVLVILLGAPPWAALGFGYLSFRVSRIGGRS